MQHPCRELQIQRIPITPNMVSVHLRIKGNKAAANEATDMPLREPVLLKDKESGRPTSMSYITSNLISKDGKVSIASIDNIKSN